MNESEIVNLKISSCQKCKGIVRVAVEHLMNRKAKSDFALEAIENDLTISSVALSEHKSRENIFCRCH
jgi:hypothetical protein